MNDKMEICSFIVLGIVIACIMFGGVLLYKSNHSTDGWDDVAEDLDANGGTVVCDGDYWRIYIDDDVTAEDTGLLVHKTDGGYIHLNYAGITTIATKG